MNATRLSRMLSVILTVFLSHATAFADAAPPPNIILFLVDDMGWQDTSVPFWGRETAFNRHFRTPNMERLAAQGIRFTNAYSHAVCSPSRTSLMTGQSPLRHKVTNWTLLPDEDTTKDWGRVAAPPDWRKEGLQPEDVTLPKLLQEAGYFTIMCGKAHFGAHHTPGKDPLALGFDVNIAGHPTGAPGSYQGLDDFGNKREGRRRLWAVPGLEDYHGEDVHLTDVLTTEAIAAVDRAVDAEKPFYLYMAHYAVHTPIQPHKRFMDRYTGATYANTDIDIPPEEERYASMVEGMDASLGALLAHVEKRGVAENTIAIFTSDNGGLSVHARGTTPRDTGANTHNWPLRAGKGAAYEGGTRAPFIATWAKRDDESAAQRGLWLEAGAVSDQPILIEDLFPTLLGIAGAADTIPDDHAVDGRDIRPYLRGGADDPDRPLHFHYPHAWGPDHPDYQPHSALRVGDWKAIYFYNDRRWELYNLARDLSESQNLADAEPEILEAMAARMQRDFAAFDAQWPVDRESGAVERIVSPAKLAAVEAAGG